MRHPTLRVVLLNTAFIPTGDPLKKMVATGRIWDNTAMLGGISVLERVVAAVGPDRLLAGSHGPFYCLDAAAMKLREAALKEADRLAIAEGNARSLLGRP